MFRLALSGSTGRMGQAIKAGLASEFQLVAEGSSQSSIENWDPARVDVVVDFSLPEGFEKVQAWCAQHGKPLVSGTTGKVEPFENPSFPLLHAGNFSLGVAAVKASLCNFSQLKGAKVWIEDVHHSGKLDAPSGTAKVLVQEASQIWGKEPEVHSIRAGSVFGVHHVHIATDQEWITLTHRALNREVFARGALKVASWLVRQPAGRYTMDDFLNLRSEG